MVITSGNSIVDAYTSGQHVSTIYAYGQKVWPSYSRPYYIKWRPANITSGTFSINGTEYQFSHYSNQYNFSTGVITESAFKSTTITQLSTNAIEIERHAFAYCESLSSIYLPNCESIGSRAFTRYTGQPITTLVTSLYAPVCSYIGSGAFYRRYFPSGISLPNCEYIGDYAFQDDTYLDSLDLPKCSYIGEYAFDGNDELIDVHLSVCEYIGDFAFANGNRYEYNSHYLSVYIYTSTVCRLGGSYVFRSVMGTTPNQSFYDVAAIYVPASLLSAYKSAQWWSDISGHIYSIPT